MFSSKKLGILRPRVDGRRGNDHGAPVLIGSTFGRALPLPPVRAVTDFRECGLPKSFI